MEKDQLSRKLAVILHADVAGSIELVRRDEMPVHQRIQNAFQQFSRIIKSHEWVAREIRGDALLVEFSRASDAVTARLGYPVEEIERLLEAGAVSESWSKDYMPT